MINKNIVFMLIVFLLFFGFVICYVFVSVKIKKKKHISAIDKISKIIIQPDEVSIKGQNVVVSVFSFSCEYCQNEAKEIRKYIKNFGDAKIFMVSSDDSIYVKKFAADYQLDSLSNVRFLYLPKEKIVEVFSSASVPRILIYNREGNLLKDFKGDVKIEKILEVIANEKK